MTFRGQHDAKWLTAG